MRLTTGIGSNRVTGDERARRVDAPVPGECGLMAGSAPAFATPYFAYGSNMDPAQMAQRCPGARPLGRAWLAGHVFRINRRGVATVVPDVSGIVHGILWALSGAHVATLDAYEGVAGNEYEKRRLTVCTDAPRDALVYIATEDRTGSPRPDYLERVLAGAVHFGLPADYVVRLAQWGNSVQGELT